MIENNVPFFVLKMIDKKEHVFTERNKGDGGHPNMILWVSMYSKNGEEFFMGSEGTMEEADDR